MVSSLTPGNIARIASELFAAWSDRRTVPPLSGQFPTMNVNDAYAIQLRLQSLHEANGAKVVGRKIGVTSRAVQEMLGVHQPDFGFLTDRMLLSAGDQVSIAESGLIQPRIEGEIVFRLGRELSGPGVTRQDVLDATEAVAAAFEIVDSRIEDWRIRIEDTVADNASCGLVMPGRQWVDPASLDLAALRMTVHRDGVSVSEGTGAAVQGHPAEAVAWLANVLGGFGVALQRGGIILSGALGPLVKVAPGDSFVLAIDRLGTALVSFVE